MRTLTLPKKGNNVWTEGWHTVVITKAKYGEYNDSKYIDVWFKGYPDNFNMRVYEKKNKSGEEFAIGSVFRFANAGISDALDSTEGVEVKIDDNPESLVGSTVNIFLYKDCKYSKVLGKIAPVEFTNVVETITENDVTYYKGAAEKFYKQYIYPKINREMETVATDDIPF